MQAVLFIKLRAEFAESKAAAGLEVVCPLPHEVSRLSCEHHTEVSGAGQGCARLQLWRTARYWLYSSF